LSREETTALLQEVPNAYHTRINEVVLTALAQALALWTQQPRLLVDLEGHGREELFADVDVSRTVGWFTTLFPLLLDLSAASTPEAGLKAIKEQVRQVPGNGLGYGVLRYLRAEQEGRVLSRQPAARISFNYLGQFDQAVQALRAFELVNEQVGWAG